MNRFLTPQAEAANDRAQEIARGANRRTVHSADLLVALLEQESTARIFNAAGADPQLALEAARRAVAGAGPDGGWKGVLGGKRPRYTDSLQGAIHEAMAQAARQGCTIMGPEFYLIGLIETADEALTRSVAAGGSSAEQLLRAIQATEH